MKAFPNQDTTNNNEPFRKGGDTSDIPDCVTFVMYNQLLLLCLLLNFTVNERVETLLNEYKSYKIIWSLPTKSLEHMTKLKIYRITLFCLYYEVGQSFYTGCSHLVVTVVVTGHEQSHYYVLCGVRGRFLDHLTSEERFSQLEILPLNNKI